MTGPRLKAVPDGYSVFPFREWTQAFLLEVSYVPLYKANWPLMITSSPSAIWSLPSAQGVLLYQ